MAVDLAVQIMPTNLVANIVSFCFSNVILFIYLFKLWVFVNANDYDVFDIGSMFQTQFTSASLHSIRKCYKNISIYKNLLAYYSKLNSIFTKMDIVFVRFFWLDTIKHSWKQ